MSNFLLRLSALFLTVTLAGVTACAAGERSNAVFPRPHSRRSAHHSQSRGNSCCRWRLLLGKSKPFSST